LGFNISVNENDLGKILKGGGNMDINEFKANLNLAELPQELENLIYFQTNESDINPHDKSGSFFHALVWAH
jgi:hypothetical protein